MNMEEPEVYINCRGCNNKLNVDTEFIAYGYCFKCMQRDYNLPYPHQGDSMWDRVKRFNDAADKYGTDKCNPSGIIPEGHGYMKYYADKLPNNPRKLLEIGCWKGASLRMWRELFPDCELHTLDLFEEQPEPTDIEGLICHKGNQRYAYVLNELPRFINVVIDDGSHGAVDMECTFNYLTKLCIVDTYVIEDLHCLRDEPYRYVETIEGNNYYMPFEDTILGKMLSGNFPHRFDLFEEKIAFIYK